MRMFGLFIALCVLVTQNAYGDDHFDHYVLALSWSPSWCEMDKRRTDTDQCRKDADFGWILHGLWPQGKTSWPSFCPTSFSAPNRSMTDAMSDIMGSSRLAWHQWKKHGTCSGLSSAAYYALSRRAFESVKIPPRFAEIFGEKKLNAQRIEFAFLETNPTLADDMVRVTCKGQFLQEIRICFSKELTPLRCAPSFGRDCSRTVVVPKIP